MNTYTYNIHLNERDEFYATVDDFEGITIFEIGDADRARRFDCIQEMIEDGFMRHSEDVKGLEAYLKSVRILQANDTLE